MRVQTLLTILCFVLSASAQSTVGMIARDYADDHRKNWEGTGPRPLRTAIWYPAAAGTGKSEIIFGGPPERELFAPVQVVHGADIANAKLKYPLVLLSHGTGGSATQLMWLGSLSRGAWVPRRGSQSSWQHRGRETAGRTRLPALLGAGPRSVCAAR